MAKKKFQSGSIASRRSSPELRFPGRTPRDGRRDRRRRPLRDLRVAEVSKLDMKIDAGKVVAFRAKVSLSFKYEA
jgi:hypothetical protein